MTNLGLLWRKVYVSDEYRKFKAAVKKRDSYTCQWCGATKNNKRGAKKVLLHVHHKVPKSVNLDLVFTTKNAILLCSKCHILAHKKLHEQGLDHMDLPNASEEELEKLVMTLHFTVYNKRMGARRNKIRKRKRKTNAKRK